MTRKKQDPPVFPRVALRMMEGFDNERVFYVNQFVLHSASGFYEGLVDFQATQAAQIGSDAIATGTDRASISIPPEVLRDHRWASLNSASKLHV